MQDYAPPESETKCGHPHTTPKSKAPIPGAIGMRAKLAFVTLISKTHFLGATGNRGKTAQPVSL